MACVFPEKSKENFDAVGILTEELESMNLSCKELTTVSTEIFNLRLLTKLNLSNNLLKAVPEEISQLANLLYLDVSSNKLTSLPKTLRNVVRLRYLNISNNSFYEVPEVLFVGLRSLRVIDMSDNLFMEFNTAPACVVSLVELNLRKNELFKFPGWIFSNECCIEYVDLSENPIEEATAITLASVCNKGSFETMREIKLQNANLNPERADFLTYLKNVEVIHLGNISWEKNKNFLEGFKSSLFKNSVKLRHLHFNGGNLAGLPNDFGILKTIQVLNLSNNCLSWLPDSFPELDSLQVCNLSSNTISFLPEKINNLKNLKELYLSQNHLCDLPNSFLELKHLQILDLYDNMIENIDKEFFAKLSNLQGLDLEQNFIDKDWLGKNENNYSKLKEKIREITNNENRLCGQKESTINDTTTEDADSFGSYSIHEEDDVDYQQEIVTEDWDEPDEKAVENEDDFFDPNVIRDLSTQMIYKRKKEKEIFRHNFCPGDSHVQPIIPVITKNFKAPVANFVIEGQFDDD